MSDATATTETMDARIIRYLGGSRIAGVDVDDIGDGMTIIHTVRNGLPIQVLEWAQENLGVSRAIFYQVIPRQTVDSARRRGGKLSQAQSERILRIAKIYALAEEAFGSDERGKAWMAEPNPQLEDMRPIELMDSQQGAEQVEAMLTRMMYGVVA